MNGRLIIIQILIVLGLMLPVNGVAWASSPREDVLSLAKDMTSYQKSASAPQLRTTNRDVNSARIHLMDQLLRGYQTDLSASLKNAEMLGVEHFDIYEAYADLKNGNYPVPTESNAYKLLDEARNASDWRRKNLADIFLAVHYMNSKDNLPALKRAQEALEVIPVQDNSKPTKEARFETYDALATVYIYDRNLEKAVEATIKHVQYGQELGRDIDTVVLLYNLSTSFAKAQDTETAIQLSAILVNYTANGSNYDRSAANYGHGKNLSAAGQFSEAIPFLKTTAELMADTPLGNAAEIHLALAYSKTGNTIAASNIVQKLEMLHQSNSGLNEISMAILEQVKSEIGARNGDYRSAYSHLESWSTTKIASLEKLAFEDRRKASESLALSDEMAKARMDRLRSEIALNNKVLEQERRLIYALFGLTAMLLMIVVILIRNRQKQIRVNAELATARDQALAGVEAKAQFLAITSHELRTPLNPIIALSEQLVKTTHDPHQRSMLRMIMASGQTLLQLVENILVVANNQSHKTVVHKRRRDVTRLIKSCAEGFVSEAKTKGLGFEFDIGKDVPAEIMIDESKIRLAVKNLLSNAFKFTRTGSVGLHVETANMPDGTPGVAIIVSDTGIGMNEADVPEYLEAFRQRDSRMTRKYEGAGLGLYVATENVEAHGGSMVVKSSKASGTRVTLYIPTEPAEMANLAA